MRIHTARLTIALKAYSIFLKTGLGKIKLFGAPYFIFNFENIDENKILNRKIA